MGFLAFIAGTMVAQTTLTLQVASSTDDAEELSASEQNSTGLDHGDLDLSSSDLELVDDASWNGVGQTVGVRFTNLDIPQGAIVIDAYLVFAIDDDNNGATTVNFKVEDAVDAATFANTPFNISSRTVFPDSVSWTIPEWTTAEIDETRQTPAVTNLVQLLVNRSDWTPGNAIAFVITGTGEREVQTFDKNPDLAPQLVVTYLPVNTVESQVSSSTDDAEQLSNSEQNSTGLDHGDLDLTSSDLELVDDASWNGVGQAVGIRFANLDVPQGAKIVEAYIEFTQDAVNTNETFLEFYTEASDDAATYQNTPFNISGRSYNPDTNQWAPAPAFENVGSTIRTSDLNRSVQQVIDREGWSSGNALAFMITGQGEREVTTFDADPDAAPKLVVKFIPVANVTFPVTSSTDDAEELSAS